MQREWLAAGFLISAGLCIGLGLFALGRGGREAAEGEGATAAAATTAPAAAEPATAGGAHVANVASLRRDMKQMSEEVAQLRQQLDEARAGPARAAEPAPPPPALRTPETRAEQERQWHQHMADVAADYQAEPIDSAWAARTAGVIRDVVAMSEAMRGTMRSTECRSETCKVEFVDDAGKLSKNLPLFVGQLGQTLPSAQADHEDQGGGKMLMTLYLTRRVPEATASAR